MKEQTERRKEEVVGFVSHELRSPLMGINLAVNELQEKFGFNHEAQPNLKMILAQVSRIGKISKDLMQSVIYNAGELQFQFRPSSLVEILDHVTSRLSEEAEEHKLKIQLEPLPQSFIGMWDPDRLDQVFSNLLSNAIKYSKPSGGAIHIITEAKDGGVRIQFRDEGLGIPDDEIDSIFQSFSRAVNVRYGKSKGYGLGLKIAKDIVEKHQGRIWAQSQVGIGSTFFVELPLKQLHY